MQKGNVLIFLLVGIVALTAIGAAFYLGRSSNPNPSPIPVATSQTPQPTSIPQPSSTTDETSTWKVYTNSQYGYSVKYPVSLNQSENQNNDTYLSSISFRGAETDSDWFNIVVRNSNLQEEIKYQKSQIEGHMLAKLTYEKEITVGSFPGVLLGYTPDSPETGTATRFIIVNNGKYSYTISGTPKILDQILSTFKFTQ